MKKHPRDIVSELYPRIRDLADNFHNGVWTYFYSMCLQVQSGATGDKLHAVIQYLKVDFTQKIKEFQGEAKLYNGLLAKLGSQVKKELKKINKELLEGDENKLFIAREGLENAYLEMKKLYQMVTSVVVLLHKAEQGEDVERSLVNGSSIMKNDIRGVLGDIKENLDRSKDNMYYLSLGAFDNLPRTGAKNFWDVQVT